MTAVEMTARATDPRARAAAALQRIERDAAYAHERLAAGRRDIVRGRAALACRAERGAPPEVLAPIAAKIDAAEAQLDAATAQLRAAEAQGDDVWALAVEAFRQERAHG